jgi:hypothetical protein
LLFSYSLLQPDQARIVGLNAQYFLKNGGHYVISIKASCIDSTAQPEAVFAREVKKLQEMQLKPREQVRWCLVLVCVLLYFLPGLVELPVGCCCCCCIQRTWLLQAWVCCCGSRGAQEQQGSIVASAVLSGRWLPSSLQFWYHLQLHSARTVCCGAACVCYGV